MARKNDIGIASLMERRVGTIAGETYFYYVNSGIVIVLKNPSFCGEYKILSGLNYNKIVNRNTRYEEYMVTDFMSFDTLYAINNTTKLDEILKIMANYKKQEGKYFIYDYNKHQFNIINDEDVITQLKENKNLNLKLYLK